MTNNKSLTKAARLLILHRMQQDGTLDDKRITALADRLNVSRWTIYRDMAALNKLMPIVEELSHEPANPH